MSAPSGAAAQPKRRPWWAGPGRAPLDGLAWVTGFGIAAAARYDFTAEGMNRPGVLLGLVLAAVLHVLVGQVIVYRGRYRYGTFEEMAALAVVVLIVGTALMVITLLGPDRRLWPASIPLLGGALALVVMAALRWVARRAETREAAPRGSGVQRALVFGAGEGGHRLVRDMVRDPSSPYLPVGLLDDDPGKRHLRMDGVRVLGTRHDIGRVVFKTGADVLVIAAPTAGGDLVREITQEASLAGVAVKALPGISELLNQDVGLRDLRDLTVDDLLGRHHIDTDLAAIAHHLTGRRVLVTGAGGSIGAELCRQIHAFHPAELTMLDRDESALHAVQLELYGEAALDDGRVLLADLRDQRRIEHLIETVRPEVVFHAAALKHLPALERSPGEAVQSNIHGTLHLLRACRESGVERFVHVSTDKAADPESVLGYTKRVAERLTAGAGRNANGCTYVSVRFGNVLASRGSVLHTFSEQIRRGGPVTVTDPAATRFFMTAAEAVELVVQAAVIGESGEVLVLDMGEPVSILELAERLMDLQNRPCQVQYTGLRDGEKVHEARLGAGEVDHRPRHGLISQTDVPPLHPDDVRHLDPWGDPTVLRPALARASVAESVQFRSSRV